MFITHPDYALAEAETWRVRFLKFLQMTACLIVGGNGGVGGTISKSHLEQNQPPLFTVELKLETVNLFLRMVVHWVRHARVAMGTKDSDKPFTVHILLLQIGITSPGEDPIHDEYCTKLHAGIADQITASAHIQKKLHPPTPVTLAYAVETVGEFSERTTSYWAAMVTPVNHGANIVPPEAATVQMPVRPGQVDHTVANANTRCYCCNSFGHEALDCGTKDTRGRGQAFHARTGGDRGRQEEGHDRTETHRGCPESSARPAAEGIKNVQAAAVEDASMNDDGENSALEQEVGDEEDGQGNGNWE